MKGGGGIDSEVKRERASERYKERARERKRESLLLLPPLRPLPSQVAANRLAQAESEVENLRARRRCTEGGSGSRAGG